MLPVVPNVSLKLKLESRQLKWRPFNSHEVFVEASKYVLEALAVVLSGAALTWIRAVSAAVRETEISVAALTARVEAHDNHLEGLKDDINRRLERVEEKLDRLLEQRKE